MNETALAIPAFSLLAALFGYVFVLIRRSDRITRDRLSELENDRNFWRDIVQYGREQRDDE